METIDAVLAAIGITLKNALAGAIGSLVSMRFFPGLTTIESWGTFGGGWALAVYLAQPVTLFFELKPAVETGISLLIGLFGMAVVAATIRTVKDTDWSGIIKGKLGGGK